MRIRSLTFLLVATAATAATTAAQAAIPRSTVPVFGTATLVAQHFSRMEVLLDGNLDGTTDAVGLWARTTSSGRLRFFANDGAGTMTEHDLIQGPFAGRDPRQRLTLGDWDGDGHQDFVVNWLDGQFTFYLARTGGPALDATVTLTTSGTIHGAAGIDLDGDGLSDLAVLSSTGVHLFLNRGGRPSIAGGSMAASSALTGELLVLDLDGDQAPDLALADHGTSSRTVQLLQVHRAPGWNGPRPGALTTLATFPIPDTDPMHTAAGDYDGDGDEDLVVFRTSGTYQVLAQTQPGVFQAQNWSAGGPATALADIDGDGDLDGICCGGGGGGAPSNSGFSRFEVSLNDGGTFRPAVAYPNLGAQRIAGAADMDGDGEIDLVAGRGILFHFRGLGETETWSAVANSTAFNLVTPTRDVDGDGDLDLIAHSATLTTFQNRGDGEFTKVDMAITPPPGVRVELWNATWGDWNGDGLPDVLLKSYDSTTFAFLGLRLYHSVDGSRFEDAGLIQPAADDLRVRTGGGTLHEFVADLDGDGDDDFVSTRGFTNTRAMRNDGNGVFTQLSWPTDLIPYEIRDLDGDGAAEVMTINFWLRHGRGGISVYAGQPNGIPGNRTDLVPQVTFYRAHVLDHDGDGDLDVVGVWPTNRLTYHENLGGGQYDMTILTENSLRTQPWVVRDIDGNGRVDICYGISLNEPLITILTSDLNGKFSVQTQVLPASPGSGALAFGDFDHDGDIDLQGYDFLAAVAHHGPRAGRAVQFGIPRSGTRNNRPLLGVQGPLRPGATAQLHLRSGSPNSLAILAAGIDAVDLPDFPWPQVNTYLIPLAQVVAPLDAQGKFELSTTLAATLAGSKIVFQAFVLDATATAGLVSTNGVDVRIGR